MSDKRKHDVEHRKRVLAEVAKRQSRIANLDWNEIMFDRQRAFIEDPARLKVAVCSRRAGKSHCASLALLKAGFENPGSYPIYMNANRSSAKVTIWPALMDIDKRLNLGLKFNEQTSDIKLPNGSVIKVYGVGSRREMDKIRGGKPPLAVLDEAQNMGSDMQYLIAQVVLPSTIDYKAAILITGTPNAACAGPFHDLAHGGSISKESEALSWSVHHWTMEDNPYIIDLEDEYDLACAASGWTRQSPGFQREMLGKWVRDDQGMAFYMNNALIVDEPDFYGAKDWRYHLGIDLGTKDPCAYTILATSRELQLTYVLESFKGKYTTLQAGTEVERLQEAYPLAKPYPTDSGGQGAAFLAQWKSTHPNIPAAPVRKGFGSVDMGINIINADARAGKVLYVKRGCEQLLDELNQLVWDDKVSVNGVRRIKRGDAFPDHCADSFRYAYTMVRNTDTNAFRYNPRFKEGSAEWLREKSNAMRHEILSEKSRKKVPYWQKQVIRSLPKFG